MLYAINPLSETAFNQRYQLLIDYLEVNQEKLFPEIKNELNNLPDEHPLKIKNLFVLNPGGKSFLHKAAREENLPLITFLKETGHDVDHLDIEKKTPLYDACAELKIASVNALLGYDANPNLGNDPISYTGTRRGLSISYQGENIPLVATIESSATITAAEFVAASMTGENFSGLTDEQATKRAAATVVKKLIAKGANLLLQTGMDNYSALQRAINHRKSLIVKEIASSGSAEIFRQFDRDGEVALHMVAAYRNKDEKENERNEMQEEKEITDIIISHAELNNIQELLTIKELLDGNTPLLAAIICSNIDVVKAIYKNDYKFSDIKILGIQNKEGNTALHEAVKEAWRGPKILAFLLSVATETDLAIVNNAGETAGQMAERFMSEAGPVRALVAEIEAAIEDLEMILDDSLANEDRVSVKPEIEQLYIAINNLEEHDPFDRVSEELSEHLDVLSANLEEYKQHSSLSIEAAEDLVERSRKLITDTKEQFFHESYLDSLKSVKQEKYFDWKAEQLLLPSGFTDLETVDINSFGYQNDLKQADEDFRLGKELFALSENELAETSLENSIKVYHALREYKRLEQAYQTVAKAYISGGELRIANYEADNRIKLLSLDNQEKLQAHLALAGLYKELREQAFVSAIFSMADLQAYESYHYKEAYKITQGDLENDANVVLQREFGIARHEKLGTYNIRQCIVVVVYDPFTQKIVLSHFDKFSGPASFIDQILNEFPGESKLDLYLSGGRDREYGIDISDNNIDQVLKQIYAYKDRFDIKTIDVGDKPSPEAVVFDWEVRQLKHAMPNRDDASLDSRAVNFMLQKNKADYLRPPNVIDFTKNVDREIAFSTEQQETIKRFINFNQQNLETDAWNHAQIFYPLMIEKNRIASINTDFSQGLLTEHLNTIRNNFLGAPIVETPKTNDDNNYIDEDDLNELLRCLGNRRRRDAGLCVLDSERLLEKLGEFSEIKQSKILEHVARRRVGGSKQAEVAKLVHNQETSNHLQKVAGISSGLMDGLFNENALADWLKGDRFPAIQLGGLKGAGYLLEKLSTKMNAKGLEWLAEGKVLQSTVLRAGTPFVRRVGGLGFVAYDLYSQASALQKDSNNTDALVGVVSDGIQIGTDLVTGGVEVAEITSARFALLGISEVTGPLGEAVVGVVMLGDKIYETEETVAREDHLLHLTVWEKTTEAMRAFLGLNSAFQKELDEITEYERILAKQFEFLQNHTDIKHVIFPAIEKIGEKRSCQRRGFTGKGCKEYKITPFFATVNDSSVYFKDKLIGFELTREELTAPAGSELLCLPTATGDGKSLPVGGAYACDGALGLTRKDSTGTAVFYNLGDGEDHAAGFVNNFNIFMINDGAKDYAGGDLADIFIINAKEVVTAVNKEGGIGGLDGGSGSDSLLLQGFQPAADRIEVNLGAAGYVKFGHKTLQITNIEKISGGAFPLAVTAGCDTQEIHLAGGPTLSNLDTLLISSNNRCTYDLNMYLQPPVSVNNEAGAGNFTYYILPGKGIVTVNLTATEDNSDAKQLKQQFVFNALISDVSSVAFSVPSADDEQKQTIKLHFLDHRIRKLLRTIQAIFFIKTNASDATTIIYQLKPNSALDLTRFELPRQLAVGRTREVLKKHLVNQAEDSFNVTLNKSPEIRHVVLSLLNKVDDENVEDFKFELNAYLSSNTSFHFIDSAELKIGNKNLYLFQQKLNRSVIEIMDRYAPTARRLNIICILTTLDDQQLAIGHNGKEVMQNNPAAKTHLNGNGGEAVFVIKSGMDFLLESQLPIKDVVLYRRVEDTQIDSLDLRALNEQVRRANATAKLRIIAPNKRNKLGYDLKLRFDMQKQDKVIRIVSIFLKDVQNHWHKKYLHIFLEDNIPLQIVGRHTHQYLKPIPLEFDLQHEIAVVGVKDVAEYTVLVIPHAYQAGAFFRDKDNLVWTNTLSNSANEVALFTLILPDFYHAPKLQTLFLQFSDRRITLKNKLAEINTAENFESVSNVRLANLREEFLAILNSTQAASGPIIQATNVSDIDISHEHNSGNEINAISIEDHADDYSDEEANEIDRFRRRRSVEHSEERTLTNAAPKQSGILQAMVNTVKSSINTLFSRNAEKNDNDKTLAMANDFYAKQDQMKTPVRKKASKHAKKTTIETIPSNPKTNRVKQIIATKKPIKTASLSNKSHKEVDCIQATSNNTIKISPFFCGKPKQIQPTYAPKNVRSNNQTFYINQSSINQPFNKTLPDPVKQHKSVNSSRTQSLFAGHQHQQYSRQQAGKSSISKVAAVGDIQGLLLLGHCMFISKPASSLNPKVVRFYQWKERKMTKEQGAQKLYIPSR